jgi:hypothetical protein
MGQQISIGKRFHVSLRDYEEIANDKYTVRRTSGEMDPDWIIAHQSGCQLNVDGPSATKHCTKIDEQPKWRIFMDNGKTTHEYMCGWRRVESIHPTRLDGDEEAIKVWRENLLVILEGLELKRLETLDTTVPSSE